MTELNRCPCCGAEHVSVADSTRPVAARSVSSSAAMLIVYAVKMWKEKRKLKRSNKFV